MKRISADLIDVFALSDFKITDCQDIFCQQRVQLQTIQEATSVAFQTTKVAVVTELYKSDYLIEIAREQLPSIIVGQYPLKGFFSWRYDFLFHDIVPTVNNCVTLLYALACGSDQTLLLDNFVVRNQVSFVSLSQHRLQEVFLDYDQETGDIIGIEHARSIYWALKDSAEQK